MASADPARVNLLQATHLGGCRFAASLVVLPQRQRYGRLSPEQAPAFLAAIESGDIYLPAFRGRAGLPEAAQLVEHAAMNWADRHGLDLDDVHLPEQHWPDPEAGAQTSFAAQAGGTELRIALQSRMVAVTGRCDALDQPAEFKPRWQVTAVVPSQG